MIQILILDGLFDNTGIEDLTLFDSIIDIQPNSFDNMTKARQAWIMNNTLPTIKNNVFTNTLFKMVYLAHNEIENIEEGAFLGMRNLGYLDLGDNLLKTISMEKVVGKSLSLAIFVISGNEFKEINKNMLSELPNIEIFNASHNSIKMLEGGCFINNELWLLDLSNNKIEQIPENVFPTPNKLEDLYLHGNNLQYISGNLLDKISNVKEMSMSCNNWQCKCYDHVRAQMEKYSITNICEVEKEYCFSENNDYCIYASFEAKPKKNKEICLCEVLDWRVIAQNREQNQNNKLD